MMRWFKQFYDLVREWWGTIAGWISVPFLLAGTSTADEGTFISAGSHNSGLHFGGGVVFFGT
jgi:hypothetical protein